MTAHDDWVAASPFKSPLPPSLYPSLAFIFLSIGLFAGGMFVVQSRNTSLFKQLQASIVASLFLGFGTIFTSLAVGVYL
ncbi:hypothetical protein VTP01DRAFT_4290 [Rhizomucor pusillus]|uniref:uncharacterized protein n=1 Tax=Rhizomucor pusillus TaxID=4840 RepID=UPI0037449E0B